MSYSPFRVFTEREKYRLDLPVSHELSSASCVEDPSRFSFGLDTSGLLGHAECDSIRHTIMIIMSSPAL